MAKKKEPVDPFTGLPESQVDAWFDRKDGRDGYQATKYWDIRDKSLSPAEAEKLVFAAAGVDPEEESAYIFRDFSTVGFFTQDTKLAIEVIERGCDFLYDKKSNLWFLSLYGHHQIVMRVLISLYTKVDFYKIDYNEAADKYIEECYGFFESGAAGYGPPTVRMGENYPFPSELKTKFNRLGFKIWRL